MKKILTLLLAVLMLVSVMITPITAENTVTFNDVSKTISLTKICDAYDGDTSAYGKESKRYSIYQKTNTTAVAGIYIFDNNNNLVTDTALISKLAKVALLNSNDLYYSSFSSSELRSLANSNQNFIYAVNNRDFIATVSDIIVQAAGEVFSAVVFGINKLGEIAFGKLIIDTTASKILDSLTDANAVIQKFVFLSFWYMNDTAINYIKQMEDIENNYKKVKTTTGAAEYFDLYNDYYPYAVFTEAILDEIVRSTGADRTKTEVLADAFSDTATSFINGFAGPALTFISSLVDKKDLSKAQQRFNQLSQITEILYDEDIALLDAFERLEDLPFNVMDFIPGAVQAYRSFCAAKSSTLFTTIFNTMLEGSFRYSNELISTYTTPHYTTSQYSTGSMTSSSNKSTYTTDENVVITWTKATNATRYGLTIVNKATSEKVVNSSNFTGTSYNVGKLPAGTYKFNMRGYNSNGNGGPVSTLKTFTVKETSNSTLTASASKYNATNALEYAASHWNDGKGLCAEFVSNCIKAGGLDAWSVGCTTLVGQLKDRGYATEYKLTLAGNGLVKYSDNSSILSPGDLVFAYCSSETDGKPYVHTYIYYGNDSSGYIKGYAHNNASNGTINHSWSCSYCGATIKDMRVLHINSSSVHQATDNKTTESDYNDDGWSEVKTTTEKPTESDILRIVKTETKYRYYHYCCNYYDGMYNVDSIKYGSGSHYYHTKEFESPLTNKSNIGDMGGKQFYISDKCTEGFQLWAEQDPVKVTIYHYQTLDKKYTITYNANGGSGAPASQTKYHMVELKLSDIIPTKSGYNFAGWNTMPDGSGATYYAGKVYKELDSTMLYAKWTPKTYTITYNANGGSGAPASQTKKHAESIELSSSKPTKNGYIFLGWSTSLNGGVEFAAKSICSVNENITLYALWQEEKKEEYYIVYNANGGKNTPTTQTKNKDEDIKISDIIPTNEGYIFNGWAIDGSEDIVYSSGDIYKENKTLYLHAIWTAKTYTLSYHANGGVNAPDNQIKTHDINVFISDTIPMKDNCIFIGWSNTLNAKHALYYSGDIFEENSNVTLYAIWEEKERNIGLGNFKKIFDYQNFADIRTNEWYYPNIETISKLGLMNGKSDNKFDPYGKITIAEAVTMAARIHSLYYTGSVISPEAGETWYDGYVDYANENGISPKFRNYDAPATRAQFVSILENCISSDDFGAINSIADGDIPDVDINESYFDAVYKFYRSGILTGSDDKGSFKPDSNITRAEVSAIITRIVDTKLRQSITLK